MRQPSLQDPTRVFVIARHSKLTFEVFAFPPEVGFRLALEAFDIVRMYVSVKFPGRHMSFGNRMPRISLMRGEV